MKVRICFTPSVDVRPADVDNEDGMARAIVGLAATLPADTLGWYAWKRFNISLRFLTADKTGSDVNGAGVYDGCLRLVQEGRADLTSQLASLPVIGTNLTVGPLVSQFETAFTSSYPISDSLTSPDLLDYLTSFSTAFLAPIFFSLLAIVLLIHLFPRRRSLIAASWLTLSSLLSNFGSSHKFRETRILVLMIVLVSATLKTQTMMTMKTEKVVAGHPAKLLLLSQLLRQKITFAITSAGARKTFDKVRDPLFRRIWLQTLSRGEQEFQFIKLMRYESDVKLMQGLVDRRHVMLGVHNEDRVTRILCILAQMHAFRLQGHKLTHAVLSQVPATSLAIIVNTGFWDKNPQLARIIRRSILISSLESELLMHSLRTYLRAKQDETGNEEQTSDCMRHATENRVTPQLLTLGLGNLKFTIIVTCSLLSAASSILILEIVRGRIVTKWNRSVTAADRRMRHLRRVQQQVLRIDRMIRFSIRPSSGGLDF